MKLVNAVMDFFAAMPFIGYKKMAELLQAQGYSEATEKRIRLLYKQLGLEGVKPKFKTTRPSQHPAGKFPYLLKNRTVRHVNEVWSTEITYIKIYNSVRPHQSLGYLTPDEVYEKGCLHKQENDKNRNNVA